MEITTLMMEDGPYIGVIVTEDEFTKLQEGQGFSYECLPQQLQDDLDATVAVIFTSRGMDQPKDSLTGIAIISHDFANSTLGDEHGDQGFLGYVAYLLRKRMFVIPVKAYWLEAAREEWIVNRTMRVAWTVPKDEEAIQSFLRDAVVRGVATVARTDSSHGIFEVN